MANLLAFKTQHLRYISTEIFLRLTASQNIKIFIFFAVTCVFLIFRSYLLNIFPDINFLLMPFGSLSFLFLCQLLIMALTPCV